VDQKQSEKYKSMTIKTLWPAHTAQWDKISNFVQKLNFFSKSQKMYLFANNFPY
jgi:hypothetical protein